MPWLHCKKPLLYQDYPRDHHQWVNRFDPRDYDYFLNFTVTSSIILFAAAAVPYATNIHGKWHD